MITRRTFLRAALTTAALRLTAAPDTRRTQRLLLRSSWQTVNIGDIAHTPGMLMLLEQHRPDLEVTLWPSRIDRGVESMLRARFPRLRYVSSQAEGEQAVNDCDFFLHGSGPGLVGWKETELARAAAKPYGFAGITLSDREISTHARLLAEARFVFLRDTDSLRALQTGGLSGARMDFGPDASFALNLRDDPAADVLQREHGLETGRYLCAVPRLRWTPYWEIFPHRHEPNPDRIRENEKFAERDHAKLREGIVAWVRTTGQRVLLAPEMTYAVPLLRPLLHDPLPADVKPHVAVLNRYWLTAEAASVYARAAAIVSFEQHSPILGIAAGVPSVLLRQPTDTRKGRMWYDLGLSDWVFEIDQTTGAQVADRVMQIAEDLPAARRIASRARQRAHEHMAAMIAAIP